MIVHEIGGDGTQIAIDGVLVAALEVSERFSLCLEKSQEHVLGKISHHLARPIDVRSAIVLCLESKPAIDRKPDAALEARYEL